MAKTREQKEELVKDLTERLGKSRSVVFASFTGVPMSATNDLRKQCKEAGVFYTVPKKTLLSRALKEANLTVPVADFEGNLGVAIAADEVAGAKALQGFSKDQDGYTILGGILEQSFIEPARVSALSKLPGKEELLGKVVGTLQAPITGFVRVLQGNISGLVRVLNAVKEQKA